MNSVQSAFLKPQVARAASGFLPLMEKIFPPQMAVKNLAATGRNRLTLGQGSPKTALTPHPSGAAVSWRL
jgi:hypothetical protein